ncbi:MAG: phage integrase N-terminal SAM-like domain-containing protein, partial [Gemmatimonadetes bacterium]|nr:phage integrase N-terminal SAM-like domain-containing protein [Gemmatimonadota bacterium]
MVRVWRVFSRRAAKVGWCGGSRAVEWWEDRWRSGASVQQKTKLLHSLRANLRLRHFSPRTEEAYVSWVRRFVRFHGLRHPAELGEREVVGFLTHLSVERRVSASTQGQALAALLFLYREVLGRPLAGLGAIPRARAPVRLPVVLTRQEVERVLAGLKGPAGLLGAMLYGSGMRLLECLTLRVKDLDLERGEVRVRRAKGARDRVTVL